MILHAQRCPLAVATPESLGRHSGPLKSALVTSQRIVATTKPAHVHDEIRLAYLLSVGSDHAALAARLASRPSEWIVSGASPVNEAGVTFFGIIDDREWPICLGT